MPKQKSKTLLILSQVYVPDPASVGQHMADAAAAMAERGWRVVVLAASRGYEDPTVKYPRREHRDGVKIRRFPFSSFGKQSIAMRLVAGTFFMLQCMLRGVFTRRLAAVLVSTSPPMCCIAAMFIAAVRRVPVKYWVMDLNPDQMVELGKLKPGTLPVRLFDALNRQILKRAADVVALDRFMGDRLERKRPISHKLTVLPPWPHEEMLEVVAHEQNPFRKQHGLDGKLVIMYSGNHGFSTPVTTVLQAALRLRDRSDIVFMFIGGGVGKKEVEEVIAQHQPANIRSLPYQPLSEIKYSLSAADVHVVTVGDKVVGVVHPCKVYGALAVARPILLVGPNPCHVWDLIARDALGWHVANGDVDGAVATIKQIADMSQEQRMEIGNRAKQIAQERFSKEILCGAFCNVLERGIA